MEELSTRAEMRSLTLEGVKARMDAEQAAALAESARAIETGQRRDRRKRLPRLKEELGEAARQFRQKANLPLGQAPPGYREAGEALKRFLRGELSRHQFEQEIRTHLTAPVRPECRDVRPSKELLQEMTPELPRITQTVVDGHATVIIDNGGPVHGWSHLLLLQQDGVRWEHFGMCTYCDGLFYNTARNNLKKTCGALACHRARKRENQENCRRRGT
jgi:hypothetical protein